MSAIATLHIAPAELLSELEHVSSLDEYRSAFEAKQIISSVYEYDGWVLATLLPVLATNYGVSLMNSHQELAGKLSWNLGSSQFIFTETEKEACLSRLDPASFSAEKLQQNYEAFNQAAADGVGEVMLDGISFLREGLRQVSPDAVAILTIG